MTETAEAGTHFTGGRVPEKKSIGKQIIEGLEEAVAFEKKEKAEKKTVRITVVLDRSGSMMNKTDDTIDAVNNFLAEQAKDQSTRALVSILLFSTDTYWLAKDVNIVHIDKLELNRKNYRCSGNTALFDAVGKAASEAQTAKTTDGIVVIVTDGGENASTEFTLEAVKDVIMQMEQRGWSFIFLGADQNAWQVGGAMGIGAHQGIATLSSAPYTPQNPSISFNAASAAVGRYRGMTADSVGAMSEQGVSLRAHATALTDEERERLNREVTGGAAASTVKVKTSPIIPSSSSA